MDAWIRTVEENEAEPELEAHYAAGRNRAGKVFNIIRIMSLNPDQIRDSMALYRNVMFGASGLSRGEREMVAVVVSRTNGCHY